MLIVCICPGLGFKCIIPSYKHPEEISREEFKAESDTRPLPSGGWFEIHVMSM